MTNFQKTSSLTPVTILLPTFNRVDRLGQALASALGQDYGNLQVIVINDGGADISGIVNSFNDDRILFIDRTVNKGKAYSLNEAMPHATGEYIAYLDDDDILYPHHVSTLVRALEENPEYGLAYSDLYKVKCRINKDNSREVLSKKVEISRDFDRFFMLYFNQVLHVSMMHRKDMLEKTGPYNEDVEILIDWDIARKMCFFTDFYHVTEVTGEFYSPVGECDRISIQQRKNHQKYFSNVLRIRNSRPAKPWSKIEDMSIVCVPDVFDKEAGSTLGLVWKHTFYPYQLYLPLTDTDMSKLDSSMPNLVKVAVSENSSRCERIDSVIEKCEGEYVVILPVGFPIMNMWVERSLYALINNPDKNVAYELENSTANLYAIVARKDIICKARRDFRGLTVKEALKASGVSIRCVSETELPYKFDDLLQHAHRCEEKKDWFKAAGIYEFMGQNYENVLWMQSMAANAYFEGGLYAKALQISGEVNKIRPTVDTLLIQAKATKKNQDFNAAIELLRKAEGILEGNQLQWT